MSTSSVGNTSEAKVMAALISAGFDVSVPFGGTARYDLVADDGDLLRIQVKTGRLRNGAVVFNASSVQRDTKENRDYYGDADLFGVYCPDIDRCYLIEVDGMPKKEVTLRIDPPKNGQKSGIRWAEDYKMPH